MAGQQTVEEVFNELKGRRLGLVKALTTDVQNFYQLCDPEQENLCLYGLPDERWEVILPVEEVPPELPEPALGINFTRDSMQETDWLSLVAFHSDSWLVSVASYLGARSGFGKDKRKRLFQMMNELPTVFEVVSGKVENQKSEAEIQHNKRKSKSEAEIQHKGNKSKSKSEAEIQHNGNKSKSKSKAEIQHNGNKSRSKSEAEIQHNGNKSKSTEIYTGKSLPSGLKMTHQPEYAELIGEEENDEQETSLCAACREKYAKNQFWICCDICEKWFHGKCVKMTPTKAKNIKHYRCPFCPIKRGRLQA